MSVVEARPRGFVLAMNQVEQLHGGFAFEGDRVYVRGRQSLMCLSITGKDGRRFEAETVAGEVLKQVYPVRPVAAKPIVIPLEPLPDDKRDKSRVTVPLRPLSMIWNWRYLLADSAAEGLKTIDTAPAKELNSKNLLEWGEDGRFDAKTLAGSPHIGLTEVMGQAIDLKKLAEPVPGKVAVFQTWLRHESTATFHFDPGHPQAQAWLGKIAVEPGRSLQIGEGIVSLVIVVPLDEINDSTRYIRPRFWPQQSVEEWETRRNETAPFLKNAVALSPDSAVGRNASRILKE
jgi:hypothetical protein